MLNYKSFLAYRALAHSSPHEILLRILESRRNLGLNFRENSAVGGGGFGDWQEILAREWRGQNWDPGPCDSVTIDFYGIIVTVFEDSFCLVDSPLLVPLDSTKMGATVERTWMLYKMLSLQEVSGGPWG